MLQNVDGNCHLGHDDTRPANACEPSDRCPSATLKRTVDQPPKTCFLVLHKFLRSKDYGSQCETRTQAVGRLFLHHPIQTTIGAQTTAFRLPQVLIWQCLSSVLRNRVEIRRPTVFGSFSGGMGVRIGARRLPVGRLVIRHLIETKTGAQTTAFRLPQVFIWQCLSSVLRNRVEIRRPTVFGSFSGGMGVRIGARRLPVGRLVIRHLIETKTGAQTTAFRLPQVFIWQCLSSVLRNKGG